MDTKKLPASAIQEYVRALKNLKGPDKNTIHFLTDLARRDIG